MSTKTRLKEALQQAMRNRNERQKTTLRSALAALQLAEVDKRGELDEPAILAILQKEVKVRLEGMEDARRAGRSDLIAMLEAEIAILEGFLPSRLSDVELQSLIDQAIEEVGAVSPADMGKVMKVLMPQVQGRADGGQVSGLVRKILVGQ